MSTHAPMRLASVIHESKCIGFLLRQYDGWQAFNADEKSIGVFTSEKTALAAVFTHKSTEAP